MKDYLLSAEVLWHVSAGHWMTGFQLFSAAMVIFVASGMLMHTAAA